jgi:hypothetical protein
VVTRSNHKYSDNIGRITVTTVTNSDQTVLDRELTVVARHCTPDFGPIHQFAMDS